MQFEVEPVAGRREQIDAPVPGNGERFAGD
jgi:hypothetical protein